MLEDHGVEKDKALGGAMKTCSNCGFANDDVETFCVKCSHFLAWETPRRVVQTHEAPDDASADEQRPPEPESASPEASAAEPAPTSEPEPVPASEPEPAPTSESESAPEAAGEPLRERGGPPSPTEPPAPERTPPPRRHPAASVKEVLSAIDELRVVAVAKRRQDLVDRLDSARAAMDGHPVSVAVVGEFKRGKSSLINALLWKTVCPTDADIVTAVPTIVRWGEEVQVTAYTQGTDDGQPTAHEERLDDLAALVSELDGAVSPVADVRSVEVHIPHRILKSGLCLVDTPGVGGLESEHGQLTLSSLVGAEAVLFVTDASQELTQPELDYLRTAVKRCPTAALVVSKTDLYPWWREISEVNRRHLEDAGLRMPVIPVSSFVRLRARRRRELDEESGFGALAAYLATSVVLPAKAKRAAGVANEVDFVASQIVQASDAERAVLVQPEQHGDVVRRLESASQQARRLANPSATWQQTLSDGVQDLASDVEHDLQRRLREVLKNAESLIDEGDPMDSWQDTEAWLRRQVASVGLLNRDLLLARARDLGNRVARDFDLEAGRGVDVELKAVSDTLDDLELTSVTGMALRRSRVATVLVAAKTTIFVPMILFSLGTALLPASFGVAIAAVAVSVGAGVGGKFVRDEGKRRREQRQQQAKGAARKYLEEVRFVMNKDTRDSLRRTQRELRDELQTRATIMQSSTESALRSAREAAAIEPGRRAEQAGRLATQTERVGAIRKQMRELTAPDGVEDDDGHG
jgi:predicted GTPase